LYSRSNRVILPRRSDENVKKPGISTPSASDAAAPRQRGRRVVQYGWSSSGACFSSTHSSARRGWWRT
jgi:hypothetical protein